MITDQVRSSLARRFGLYIGALTPADRHVDGVVEMMLDATQKYQDPLTEEHLLGWHAEAVKSACNALASPSPSRTPPSSSRARRPACPTGCTRRS